LFEPGVAIQPCTAAVASTEMNTLVVEVATPVATALPTAIPELPVTVNSLHGVELLTVSILMVPPELT
jgi:hypothetical protein